MRLALVVPGGVDRSLEYRVIPALLALIKRLARHHDVQVFALRQEAEPSKWDLHGARVHNIGFRHTYLRAIREIYTAHRSSPVDLVHAIWSGPCGLVAVAAAQMLRIPSVIHVAGGELVALPAIGYGGRLKWRGRAREALVLRATSAITAASVPVIEALSALGLAAQRVPLGVDLEMWPPREPVRRDLSRPAQLIHVASLNRIKDQSTLLRALAALAVSGFKFEMDIVGEDTLGGEMQAIAAQSGLSGKVRFHGFLPQRLLRPLLESAHLLVMSSRHETGPLVMLEAAVAGVPTVGTAVGHIAEWAPGAAVAVPIGNAGQMASAIGRLLANEELRLQIAMRAMRRATVEDADHTAAQFQDLYARLVGRKAAS
jgi:glycosyltransferase involved in cell wall biosynthesis